MIILRAALLFNSFKLLSPRALPFLPFPSRSFAAMSSPIAANPLVTPSFLPRYADIKAEHVVPGMTHLLDLSTQELAALEAKIEQSGHQLSPKEFLEALETLGQQMETSWSAVSHLKAVKDHDELRAAVENVQPQVVAFGLKLGQSLPIYKQYKSTLDAHGKQLSEPQLRIVEKGIQGAEHAGVALEGEAKARFNAIAEQLAQLSTTFTNNVLDGTKAFSLLLASPEQVAGLPSSALGMFAQAAKAKGHPDATAEAGPWLVTLDAPSYMPVMQHAKDRQLRETVYRAYLIRASDQEGDGAKDNSKLINQILQLKQEKAKLLGKSNFAELSLASKMATFDQAMALLTQLRDSSHAVAVKELTDLRTFAAERLSFKEEMMPWDVSFFAERLREAEFDFNEEELRPYFSLPRVLEGLFKLANKLFGVDVVPATGIDAPKWHEDVQFWQINRDGSPVAYFYLDPYSRPHEKRQGAWMDSVVGRSRVCATAGPGTVGGVRLPVAHMVCNGSPPVEGKPSLMSFRDVETIFHEFGHALQHMLTTQEESMVAGISGVEWDAVELPSQFMENWCYDKTTVDGMAVHFETGAPIPLELWAKVKAAKNFRSASMMLRQLLFAVTDLTLHSSFDPNQSAVSVHDVYRDVARTYHTMPLAPYDRFLCAFSHIFAGGYSAGYYSYKWAEVLSADCFGAFEDVGLDNDDAVRATGRRFRDTVLAFGGGRAPEKVFHDFRGRDPTPAALLRHSGLISA